jgi:hypothetical protein
MKHKNRTRKLHRNSYTKYNKTKSRSRGRGCFSITTANKTDKQKLTFWFTEEGDKLNKLLIKIYTYMTHNTTCDNPVIKKKYIFTNCVKPIEPIQLKIQQLIQKVVEFVKLKEENNSNFDYKTYVNIFIEQSNVHKNDIIVFNIYQALLRRELKTKINNNIRESRLRQRESRYRSRQERLTQEREKQKELTQKYEAQKMEHREQKLTYIDQQLKKPIIPIHTIQPISTKLKNINENNTRKHQKNSYITLDSSGNKHKELFKKTPLTFIQEPLQELSNSSSA